MRGIVALVAALILASTAHANFGGGGDLAKRIAIEHFPEHCAPYSIRYRPLVEYLEYTQGKRCRILLDPALAGYSFAYRCTLLVKGFSHLAGYPDSKRGPPILRVNPPIFKPCVRRMFARAARARPFAITGGWYGGCFALNPSMPDFPECRPI